MNIKIININVNGIRSAVKKNFLPWLEKQNADLVCLQEVRMPIDLLQSSTSLHPPGYYVYSVAAQKNGYSGVTIFSKHKPNNVITTLGWPVADLEGRYIQLDFDNFKIANIYIPSGTSGELRQSIKYEFLNNYQKVLENNIKDSLPFIICGDFNIAHRNIDLKNWKANQKSSGFLPQERAWLDLVFDNIGFVDAYRFKNPEKVAYTWWSNFGKAWENNIGWRIDYQIITPQLKNQIISTEIYRQEKFSDHAPVIIEYVI